MDGVVLLGGEPGIGKSTMLLQASDAVSKSALVLYCTGEESVQQVSLRAKRLGMVDTSIKIDTEIEVEKIIASCQKVGAKVLVVDSIQTMYTGTLESAPGSVAQVRECAAMLNRFAKTHKVSVVMIGHVTKDGGIAGPRVLEHLVDTVLFFEGEPGSPFRILRSLKNRFGSANEIGVFSMGQHGLEEVLNPSSMFLTAHEKPVPGTCVLASAEGNRSFLVEVQALVEDSVSPNPRRQATGLDSGRIQMLLAVLAKHCGIDAHDKACYIKVVGGVKLTEPAADLPTLLAVVSSLRDKALPSGVISFGEVGLAGEVRPVQNAEVRLKEAAKLGFKFAIIPAGNVIHESYPGIEVKRVSRLDQALYALREIIENTSILNVKKETAPAASE